MKAHILTGSKSEIAESVSQLQGEIREAIVFIEEPTDSIPPESEEDIFAEMEALTVKVGSADDAREAVYTRMEGE
jgi:hypothetical protein